MKKILLFFVMLIVCVWQTELSACQRVIAAVNSDAVTLCGTLELVGMPCEPNGDCPDCLTPALIADNVTYYLTDLAEQWESDIELSADPIEATIAGAVIQQGSYTYLKVASISKGCEKEYTYHPLLTDSKTWSYLYNSSIGPDFTKEVLSTRKFSVNGDTTVFDQNYKLISSDWKDHTTWIFREDVNEQKVYARVLANVYCDCADCYYCNGTEYLLYDFSANKGDTIEVLVGDLAYDGTFKYVVKDVYYGNIQPNNELHKHVELTPAITDNPLYVDDLITREITWIEGIGSTYYEFIPMLLEPDGYGKLMCVSEGDDLTYTTAIGRKYDCYVDTVIDNTALNVIDGLNIRLVVTEGVLQIESNDAVNNIAVYDLQGKQVMQSEKPVVDISPLSSGLYLVMVQTEKGLWSDKFVVK